MAKIFKKKKSNVSTTLPKDVEVKVVASKGFTEEEAVKIEKLTEVILSETAGKYKDIERKDVIPCLQKIVYSRTGKLLEV